MIRSNDYIILPRKLPKTVFETMFLVQHSARYFSYGMVCRSRKNQGKSNGCRIYRIVSILQKVRNEHE